MEELSSWLYVSSSRLSESGKSDALDDLIAISRQRNELLKITGALLFTGTRFLQFIEGPSDNIETLKVSIFGDPRHEYIRTLAEAPISARHFLNWSLAYAGPSQFIGTVMERALSRVDADPRGGAATLIRLLQEFSFPLSKR